MKGFLRPPVIVLPDTAEVPARNRITPPPNQFTHEVIRPQPFYFVETNPAIAPDGTLPAGTKVVLMVYAGGRDCRVIDGMGLYVEIAYLSLRKL